MHGELSYRFGHVSNFDVVLQNLRCRLNKRVGDYCLKLPPESINIAYVET